MINEDYTPYDMLLECVAQLNDNTKLLHKLANAHNAQEHLLAELTKQHQMLCDHQAKQDRRIKHLEVHYELLKKQIHEIKYPSANNS